MRPILWLSILMLTLAPSGALAQHTVLVKAESSLTLRETASSTGKAQGKLVRFQPVELLSQSGEWAKIKTTEIDTGKAITGFVLATYLTPGAFAYTGEEKVNGRYGPGTQYDVIIEYDLPNIPFSVRQVSGDGWVMVMDYDGDRSWVNGKSLKLSGRYVITKEKTTNVRKGVGIGEDQVFIAPKGTILQVLEAKELADGKKWLHVKHSDGDEGWLSSNVVFGWNDVGAPEAVKPAAESESGAKSGNSDGKSAKSTKSGAADTAGKKGAKAATTKKVAAEANTDKPDAGSGKAAKGQASKTSRSTTKKVAAEANTDKPDAGTGKAAKGQATKTSHSTTKKAAAEAESSDSGSGKNGKAATKKATRSTKKTDTSDDEESDSGSGKSGKTAAKKTTRSASKKAEASSDDDDSDSGSGKSAAKKSARNGAGKSESTKSDSKKSSRKATSEDEE